MPKVESSDGVFQGLDGLDDPHDRARGQVMVGIHLLQVVHQLVVGFRRVGATHVGQQVEQIRPLGRVKRGRRVHGGDVRLKRSWNERKQMEDPAPQLAHANTLAPTGPMQLQAEAMVVGHVHLREHCHMVDHVLPHVATEPIASGDPSENPRGVPGMKRRRERVNVVLRGI
ncbi:hypothetical protein H257_01627 [Aphanomyces astaci]|uniref:Uncharacterized protein n=1 Tax=Aphanomyces astaci TaxID=112090 RepID=W4H327_APHAT|nr:hypothetical protein H257_01627 [Aphanomyces astaci]ETV86430.1 hypothetical protein H257_01627 [Aphanomyces astaci]|eukprot:XP_009823229.1 hypothetical protein H257_01627 [Aphanomyces astaci]